MREPGADFEPLIQALEIIARNPELYLDEQMALFELLLTGAEINPNCINAVEINYALKVLQAIDLTERGPVKNSMEVNKDLAPYFE